MTKGFVVSLTVEVFHVKKMDKARNFQNKNIGFRASPLPVLYLDIDNKNKFDPFKVFAEEFNKSISIKTRSLQWSIVSAQK